MRIWVGVGALSALVAIILGALGGHEGAFGDADARRIFETASDYHFVHTLGTILVGVTIGRLYGWLIHLAAGAMLAGTLLFCGTLYGTAFFGPHPLAFAAPIGGLLLMAGWVAFAVAALWKGKT